MAKYMFNSLIMINEREISCHSPCYVIAEAGVNHNGDMTLAYKLIDAAVAAGADAVKFQLFNTKHLILPTVDKAQYQKSSGKSSQTQYEMLEQLEISIAQCQLLQEYCQKVGITFLVTPFDELSLEQLASLQLSALKISSTDLTNIPFLDKAAALKIPLILSTGMSELSEVELALSTLAYKTKDVILLQCTSSYPSPETQIDLKVIRRYQQDYGVLAGYSDHTPGLGVAPYAVAAGSVLIEKHFTLDKSLPGPDHQASLDPEELTKLVREIKRVDSMLGSEIKKIQLCEQENRRSLQKAFVAKQAIKKGAMFTADNIVAMRTGGMGISPIYSQLIFGAISSQDYDAGDIISV